MLARPQYITVSNGCCLERPNLKIYDASRRDEALPSSRSQPARRTTSPARPIRLASDSFVESGPAARDRPHENLDTSDYQGQITPWEDQHEGAIDPLTSPPRQKQQRQQLPARLSPDDDDNVFSGPNAASIRRPSDDPLPTSESSRQPARSASPDDDDANWPSLRPGPPEDFRSIRSRSSSPRPSYTIKEGRARPLPTLQQPPTALEEEPIVISWVTLLSFTYMLLPTLVLPAMAKPLLQPTASLHLGGPEVSPDCKTACDIEATD